MAAQVYSTKIFFLKTSGQTDIPDGSTYQGHLLYYIFVYFGSPDGSTSLYLKYFLNILVKIDIQDSSTCWGHIFYYTSVYFYYPDGCASLFN